jgi:flagellar biosynthesis chaperone FliJ
MFDLFKGSSERERSLLLQQINELSDFESVPGAMRDAAWQARRDVALSLARDVMKRVLPPDSTLYATYAKVVPTPDDLPQRESRIDPYELEMYRIALRKVAWNSISRSAGDLPSTRNPYSEVERALPEMVYRHPAFKAILAVLLTLVVFAFTGVIEFRGMRVDVNKMFEQKEREFDTKFTQQKSDIERILAARLKESDDLAIKLKRMDAKAADLGTQLDQLQGSAERTLAKFSADAASTMTLETDKNLAKLRTTLDGVQTEAVKRATAAGDKRVAEIMALDGGDAFRKAVHEFELRAITANKEMSGLEERQKVFEGRQLIIGKATKLLDNPSPRVVDRLSAYFGEALWVVWGTGAALTVFLLTLAALVLYAMFKKS